MAARRLSDLPTAKAAVLHRMHTGLSCTQPYTFFCYPVILTASTLLTGWHEGQTRLFPSVVISNSKNWLSIWLYVVWSAWFSAASRSLHTPSVNGVSVHETSGGWSTSTAAAAESPVTDGWIRLGRTPFANVGISSDLSVVGFDIGSSGATHHYYYQQSATRFNSSSFYVHLLYLTMWRVSHESQPACRPYRAILR